MCGKENKDQGLSMDRSQKNTGVTKDMWSCG